MKQRLQKIISSAGISSRRAAEVLLTEGRVKINGKVATVGDKADPIVDEIQVDGTLIKRTKEIKVILLNKPIGFISSCNDEYGRKTVFNLLPKSLREGLHPIGRLDKDSRGALLLTNHGELTLKLTHPKYSHAKSYYVWLKGIPSEKAINSWKNGIYIESKKTGKAEVERIQISDNKTLIRVTLREGRNRQIRKMAEYIGHPVIDLKRISIADIHLGSLKEGDWRNVNKSEWGKFLTSIQTL